MIALERLARLNASALGAAALGVAGAGLVGSIAIGRALRAADSARRREAQALQSASTHGSTSPSHAPVRVETRTDLAAPPAARSLRDLLHPLRATVAIGGALCVAGGLFESTHGNWWLGLLVAAGGVLSMVRSFDIGVTPTDSRLRPGDRTNVAIWLLVPVAALLLVARAVWLVAHGGGPGVH